VSRNKLARDIDVPVGRISDIVSGKRGITPDTALRLSKYFGTDAELWMRLQSDYDLYVARDTSWSEIEPRVRAYEPIAHQPVEPVAVAAPVASGPNPSALEPDPQTVVQDPEPVAMEPDLEPVATEPDLEPVATEPDLEPVATEPDLEPVATEPDLEPVATELDPDSFASKIEKLEPERVTLVDEKFGPDSSSNILVADSEDRILPLRFVNSDHDEVALDIPEVDETEFPVTSSK
jgi:addiction module HigA family antidote